MSTTAAKDIGKLEGWKYTPLHGVVLPDSVTPLAPVFDNKGDQYIWDRAGAVDTIHIATGQSHYQLDDAKAGPITAQKITVEAGAHMLHVRLFDAFEAPYFAPVHVTVGAGGTYTQLTVSHGGKLLRLSTQVELLGETARADLRGIHKVADERHVDQMILIKHMAPNCESNQNVRYVIDGEANAAFQGKIFVDQVAQKTMAYQLCKSLLLSDSAQMNTKPELEIYADDVKCSHGATTGALDEKAMFYLQSRGVPKAEAQKLLMQAFVEAVLEDLELPDEAQAALERHLS